MANPKNQYVVVHGDRWAVKGEGCKRATKVFSTQSKAVEYGISQAQRLQSELRVQDRNGKFRTCNSYGNDPCPPKDKNR